MTWTVYGRCRWCDRVHGPPKCEPVDEPQTETVANSVANAATAKVSKYADPEKRKAYMREFMRRKRAQEKKT